jgi:hypothetical protein
MTKACLVGSRAASVSLSVLESARSASRSAWALARFAKLSFALLWSASAEVKLLNSVSIFARTSEFA